MGICSSINLKNSVDTWEDSIREAATPLLKDGSIEASYIDAMIENVLVNGPYIVIAPNIAMPHARCERGALKSAISVLKLNEPVMYPEDMEVKLIICLAAKDQNEHLDAISNLADFFMDDNKVEKVMHTKNVSEIAEVFSAI